METAFNHAIMLGSASPSVGWAARQGKQKCFDDAAVDPDAPPPILYTFESLLFDITNNFRLSGNPVIHSLVLGLPDEYVCLNCGSSGSMNATGHDRCACPIPDLCFISLTGVGEDLDSLTVPLLPLTFWEWKCFFEAMRHNETIKTVSLIGHPDFHTADVPEATKREVFEQLGNWIETNEIMYSFHIQDVFVLSFQGLEYILKPLAETNRWLYDLCVTSDYDIPPQLLTMSLMTPTDFTKCRRTSRTGCVHCWVARTVCCNQ